jgi:hypothetical protein
MTHVAHYETLTDLWHEEMETQLFATRRELDFVASVDTIRYDCLLSCDSMQYDFDMGRDLWLNASRFTTLQKDYLDLYQLESFLKRCKEIGMGEAKRGVITQLFAKQHAMREKKYRWGNCMLGWDFRGGDRYGQPTLTMHSRVSYIAYIGGLDLALCWVLAREIGDRIGKKPEDFAFRWYLSSSQFHFFKSIPALFRHDIEPVVFDESQYPSKKYPTLSGVRRHWLKVAQWHEDGVPLEDQRYGPLKRIRRRYEEYKAGDFLPSVPVDQLTLDKLRETG